MEDFLALVEQSVGTLDPGLLIPLRTHLAAAVAELRVAIAWCAARRDASPRDLAASDMCELFGIVAVGWRWAELARASADALARPDANRRFHLDKIRNANFYATRFLTCAVWLRQQIEIDEPA